MREVGADPRDAVCTPEDGVNAFHARQGTDPAARAHRGRRGSASGCREVPRRLARSEAQVVSPPRADPEKVENAAVRAHTTRGEHVGIESFGGDGVSGNRINTEWSRNSSDG